jgi:hypothetical protein
VESLPELTVVVPTHDVEPWVDDCLTSIRSQQGIDLRIIVIDDHSTDGTLSVVRRHAAEDSRLTVVESVARGGGTARNLGASLAATDYLAFADGDDLVPPGAYAALAGSLMRSGSDMAVGNFYKFAALRSWRPSLRWRAFDHPREAIQLADSPRLIWNRACWNRVFRTDFWRSTGIVFPDVPRSNDIVPMTTALVSAEKIDVVPDYVYLYRERPGSGSMTASAGSVGGLLSYLQQEVACAELLAAQPAAVRDEYQHVVFDADGWVHLRRALLGAHREGVEVPDGVVEPVRRLISAAAPSFFAQLPLERRLVLELVSAGKIADAIECLVRLESGWSPDTIDADLRFWVAMAATGFTSPNDREAALADLVLEPLSRVAPEVGTELVRSALPAIDAARLPDLEAHLLLERRFPLLRIARSIRSLDAEGLVRGAVLQHHEVFVLRRVAFSRGRIELEGETTAAPTGTFPVVARPVASGPDVAVGALAVATRPDGTRGWVLKLRAGGIRDGEWNLVVAVDEDDLGPIETEIVAGNRGPVVPDARWARLVVLPRHQPGERVRIVARGTLLRRVLRRGRSWLVRTA